MEYILHGDRITIHRKGIKTGMPACHNSDFCKLFRSGAILVHVSSGCHGVSANKRITIRSLVSCFGDGCWSSSCAEHTPSARELVACIGDECHFTLTCTDCCNCMVEVCFEG